MARIYRQFRGDCLPYREKRIEKAPVVDTPGAAAPVVAGYRG
jgi:hypothetical protein